MKFFKKILKIAALAILLILAGFSIYIACSGPALSDESNEIITRVIEDPLPEFVRGKAGFATSQGLDIWYESIMPETSPKGAVLLIMGISNDALGWPQQFLDAFVDSGYQVISYDHRGVGMSDWVKNWDASKPYSLGDMAADAIAVLDTLGIQKANIVGVSMGGMIAQELVIRHPERAASLTSIASSGYIEDPDLPAISSAVAFDLIKVGLKYGIIGGEKNILKLHLASRVILMGDARYPLETKVISEQVLYNIRKRRGYNMHVSPQHHAAVRLSGSRYEKLRFLSLPTLIIHGKSDPFIPIAHGKKCAEIIPNADTLWLDNMAHGIPGVLVDTLSKRMMEGFR
ncbi:MAG: alpha/beta hydrolase [Saprospiraceae bacterium]|nr:alpha/beta hydrolase [Saprospiraceae bacterium]